MAKTTRKPKATKGEIIAFLDAARAFIASEIEAGYGPPGPRAIYYALRSSLHPGIGKGCEKLVNNRLVAARKRWIAGDRSDYALDPTLIADDYRWLRGNDYHRDADDWLTSLRGLRMNPWTSQGVRVIVLCEKAGKFGVVEKACADTRTPCAPMGGNHSIPFGMVLAAEVAEYREAGLRVRVIYVGDHDPQGVRMDGNIMEALNLYPGELSRVAIGLDQARELGLPTEDVILSSNKSERTKQVAYTKEHGWEQVELDAMKSVTLEKVINDAIWAEVDVTPWNERVDEMEVEERKREAVIRRAEKMLDEWDE